nr:terminase small subunit [Aerococcus urinae]
MTTIKLTAKQQLFVVEYLKDLNATQAAIRAGYSKKSAAEVGHENLRKPQIAEAIEAAMNARTKRAELDADWVLKRLAEELGADLNDLFDEAGAMKPMKDWPMVWRQGLVAGIEVEEITVGKGDKKEVVGYTRKIKLSDRAKRLELFGRHVDVGAWRDKIEHDVGDPLKQLAQEISGRGLRPREEDGGTQ